MNADWYTGVCFAGTPTTAQAVNLDGRRWLLTPQADGTCVLTRKRCAARVGRWVPRGQVVELVIRPSQHRRTVAPLAVGDRLSVSVADDADDGHGGGWRCIGSAAVVSIAGAHGSVRSVSLRALDAGTSLIPGRLDAVEGEPDTWTDGARWHRFEKM